MPLAGLLGALGGGGARNVCPGGWESPRRQHLSHQTGQRPNRQTRPSSHHVGTRPGRGTGESPGSDPRGSDPVPCPPGGCSDHSTGRGRARLAPSHPPGLVPGRALATGCQRVAFPECAHGLKGGRRAPGATQGHNLLFSFSELDLSSLLAMYENNRSPWEEKTLPAGVAASGWSIAVRISRNVDLPGPGRPLSG